MRGQLVRALDYQGTLSHVFLLQLQVFSFPYGRQQHYMLAPTTSQPAVGK